MGRRTISPYESVWVLSGLRMYKEDSINDTLRRIAKQELGLTIDQEKRAFIGQYVGKFQTENERQDLSTGYLIRLKNSEEIKLDKNHFSRYELVKSIPASVGAMYKFYLEKFLVRFDQNLKLKIKG